MKITLAAMLTVAAATVAADAAWAWDGSGYAGAPSESITRTDPRSSSFAGSGSNGFGGWLTDRTYGIRCTLTAAPDEAEQRRPLRWLLRRCRPWAA
jgi:hypothetical protein